MPSARLVIVADRFIKTRISIQVFNDANWELVDTMHHRINFARDVIDLSRFVPTQENLRVRLLGASHFILDQVGLDTSPPHDTHVQVASLLGAVHSTGEDVTPLLNHRDTSYAGLAPGEEILLTFDVPPGNDEARSFVFVSYGHYVHKYQPLQATEVSMDGLNVSFGAVIPRAPLGQFWDIEIAELHWDFGDGATATGVTVAHAYGRPGEFLLAVEVGYADGTVKRYERIIILSG